jgi:arabinoxylan arabinofuranohydrolase
MCGEPIKIAEDGRITKTEVTSCGLNGGLLQGTGRYKARIVCNLSSAGGTFMY